MKAPKHKRITRDYEKQKQRHLEKLASDILKKDEINQKMKSKNINPDIFNLF